MDRATKELQSFRKIDTDRPTDIQTRCEYRHEANTDTQGSREQEKMSATDFDHAFERDEHWSEVFVDGEQMKHSREVENVSDGEQTLAHVHRVPRVPVVTICHTQRVHRPIAQ